MPNSQNIPGLREKKALDRFWDWLTLVVGYPFAFIILLMSKPSPQGFAADLRGKIGRAAAREWGEAVLVALVLALLIRSYLFQPFRIPSGSMRMTLIEEDRLFVNKLAYGPSLIPVELRAFSSSDTYEPARSLWTKFLRYRLPGFTKPKRGDVVVFRFPVTRDKDFIKRLIAVGGETVEIRNGKVFINDKPVTDGTMAKIHYFNDGYYGRPYVKILVPQGYFFVMGDNSASSHDSRYWGFVPEHFMIGRADVIFWPLNRLRWIR